MIPIILAKLKPVSNVLAGAGVAEEHRDQIIENIALASHSDSVILLDFAGVEAVTASYLKVTIPLFYGESELIADEPAYPLYTNLSRSTEEDLDHFLAARGWPGMVVAVKYGKPNFSKLLGALEAAPTETLQRLSKIGFGSAADVMQLNGGTEVALTAWNNRLAELARLRLAKRTKKGRFWIYKPIVEVTKNG